MCTYPIHIAFYLYIWFRLWWHLNLRICKHWARMNNLFIILYFSQRRGKPMLEIGKSHMMTSYCACVRYEAVHHGTWYFLFLITIWLTFYRKRNKIYIYQKQFPLSCFKIKELIYFVSSNSKTTIIYATHFCNFAGESPQNTSDPTGSRSARKVFKIDIKMQGLYRLVDVHNHFGLVMQWMNS